MHVRGVGENGLFKPNVSLRGLRRSLVARSSRLTGLCAARVSTVSPPRRCRCRVSGVERAAARDACLTRAPTTTPARDGASPRRDTSHFNRTSYLRRLLKRLLTQSRVYR